MFVAVKNGLGSVKGGPYTYLAIHSCRHSQDVCPYMGRTMGEMVDRGVMFSVIIG